MWISTTDNRWAKTFSLSENKKHLESQVIQGIVTTNNERLSNLARKPGRDMNWQYTRK